MGTIQIIHIKGESICRLESRIVQQQQNKIINSKLLKNLGYHQIYYYIFKIKRRSWVVCVKPVAKIETWELENPDIDECTGKWLKQANDKIYSLVGPLIRAKAKYLHTALRKWFLYQHCWLVNVKEINSISFKIICGKSEPVDIGGWKFLKRWFVQMIFQ